MLLGSRTQADGHALRSIAWTCTLLQAVAMKCSNSTVAEATSDLKTTRRRSLDLAVRSGHGFGRASQYQRKYDDAVAVRLEASHASTVKAAETREEAVPSQLLLC
ncbi:hypothetical protein K466DRAFT_24426 [Polyporus arcularius HHB13444]|uniref:Uncharacterized protein n=1 Tax=Polyporus arcularius HHB13444 TaxID=1314778 RepID=A0A5C3NRG6_9APHY|nr:hypothetical protein K466DRAFT_24426 [Polyporus arcularius HHB13444]